MCVHNLLPSLRIALYWVITQRVAVITTACCVITQKRALLNYFVAEAWNHA